MSVNRSVALPELRGTQLFALWLAMLTCATAPATAGENADRAASLPDMVATRARELAQVPYENPDAAIPQLVRSIAKEQWDKITPKHDHALWADLNLPFQISLHHPGFIYNHVVRFNVVDKNIVSPVEFSTDMFDYSSAELREQAAENPPGFAGFSLLHAAEAEKGLDAPGAMEELANFLGASYFQSLGRSSRFGVHARAIAVDTALPDGEEFPWFREFWLEKPEPGATTFTFHALVDSPRLTGALSIVVTPGTSTVMDVDAKWFLRQGAKAPGKIGFAPLTSMFLCGEATNGRPGDYRPEVHNSDGLLCNTADGEWIWSPLVNPARLVVNLFPMENPRGFGLMQRDDMFDHYQDLDARFDRRPSLWVEPKGDWQAGRVELVEIPGSEDFHGNIVAYWVPDAQPPADAGQGRPHYEQSYRLYWMTPGVSPHTLGRAVATRILKDPHGNIMRFMIDFEGEELDAFHADTGLASLVETPEQFPLVEKKLVKNDVTSGWRLTLDVRMPAKDGILDSLFSARSGAALRFKALLKRGENLPEPLTETWVYDFQP